MAFPPPHSFMFHSSSLPDHQDQAPPHHFHGGRLPFAMKRSTSFSGVEHQNNFDEVFGDDGLSDDGSQLGEKKKRLNIEQVKALEKSFELGNKLEPERKVQLAKALGMQPRQIAIWFQNRRARWKTKQLEKDYEVFKKQFDALKADNDALQAQHTKLNAELMALKSRDSSNASSENIADVNLGISRTPLMSSPVSSQLSGKNLFPMSHQPHQDTSRSNSLHCLKINDDHDHHQVLHQDHEHSFNIMFNSIDDQQDGFWPWPDHHHQQQQQNNFH